MQELKERAPQLLGIHARWYTVACLGDLVDRLEKETIQSSLPSRLAKDLKKNLDLWRPRQDKAPECVRDFFRAVDDIKTNAELGRRDSATQCTQALQELERGLRGLSAAGR